jgi:cytidyltransferase-like protein
MKFGRTLREKTLKEWRYYSVDYKKLKKILKTSEDDPTTEFETVLSECKEKLARFYGEKETWALDYIKQLEERVEKLRDSAKDGDLQPARAVSASSLSESYESCSDDDSDDDSLYEKRERVPSTCHLLGLTLRGNKANNKFVHKNKSASFTTATERSDSTDKSPRDVSDLKEEYRSIGTRPHFQNFVYAKKSLSTFDRELDLLMEFLSLNATAFYKILKKFDKMTGEATREEKLSQIYEELPFLNGTVLAQLKDEVSAMLRTVEQLKPQLPEGWENRKVYTIGCFDLFHRGHQNVLQSLREFGFFIVAGIHDDESYFKLKNKYTIDNLETRMANAKPYVDQMFVIPSTDPLEYVKAMVSEQDIESGQCCYARGDDMLQFPGREWIESVMPVYFVPRTESCSSTLIRTIYHAEDETIRNKAAFAKTRYDGKPVDDDGNVLKLSQSAPVLKQ